MALIQKAMGSSSVEPDQTIPMHALDSIFQDDTPVSTHHDTLVFEGTETPKSSSLKTHKRMSSTVLIKKGKRQLVGEAAAKSQQQGKQSTSSVIRSIPEEKTIPKQSFVIPNTELEASTLLDDIKERRVSAMGLNDNQLLNLAKLIATMTGTDESMVYQLISLLPKKNEHSSSRSSGQSYVSNTTNRTSSNHPGAALPNHHHHTGVLSSSSDLYSKPISSVLPIHAEKNPPPSHHQRHHQYPENLTYMQSMTSGPPERFSYPQPLFERPHMDQRLAVCVSPVRNNTLHNINGNNLTTTILTSSTNSSQQAHNDTTFQQQQLNSDTQSFMPLPVHVRTSSGDFIRSSDEFLVDSQPQLHHYQQPPSMMSSSTKQQHPQSFQSFSHHDSVIHPDSILYPRDVDFDVCCSGVPSKRIIQIKNTNKCWMQVQLHVAFFAFNGREVSFFYFSVTLLCLKMVKSPVK